MNKVEKGKRSQFPVCLELGSLPLSDLLQTDKVAVVETTAGFSPDQQPFAKEGCADAAGRLDGDTKHEAQLFPGKIVDAIAFPVAQTQQQAEPCVRGALTPELDKSTSHCSVSRRAACSFFIRFHWKPGCSKQSCSMADRGTRQALTLPTVTAVWAKLPARSASRPATSPALRTRTMRCVPSQAVARSLTAPVRSTHRLSGLIAG